LCTYVQIFLYAARWRQYRVSNFKLRIFQFFCAHIVTFWTTCIARKMFSLVVMSNDKYVLPVLHWLEVVIAFVSSWSLSFASHTHIHVANNFVICAMHFTCQTLNSCCAFTESWFVLSVINDCTTSAYICKGRGSRWLNSDEPIVKIVAKMLEVIVTKPPSTIDVTTLLQQFHQVSVLVQSLSNSSNGGHSIECKLTPSTQLPKICFCTLWPCDLDL